ncbi:hypothetical protein NW762_005427 [Fusarium torreyae]|uniref:Lysine-specific metallo-endopeptidase domain-containing protein n=1 Tax=Fusarium torreyae TaxID=1237075 RepID=A0A9W8S530_9HYPO|nr:hypothetical protein NW762_005427 [Fusarium torreyae]
MSWRKIASVAVATLSLASVANAQNGNIAWDPVGNTCDDLAKAAGAPDLQTAVKKVWQEIESMASNALDLLNKVESGVLTTQSDPWEFYRVVATYDTFFDYSHQDGQNRLTKVKNALSDMSQASKQDNVYIACDDDFMYQTDSNGHVMWQQPHLVNVPNAPLLDMGPDKMTCKSANQQGKALIGYRSGDQAPTPSDPCYVVVCAIYQLKNVYLDSLPVQSGVSLDDYKSFTTTLFHEWLHVMQPKIMRGDMSGGTAAGGERYGVSGTQQVRSDYSPENPDSITLFAVALAANQWFWGTTQAESAQDVWNRLDSDAAGKQVIQNLKLTKP